MESLLINAGVIFMTVWGGVKLSMNGVYKKLDGIEAKVEHNGRTLSKHGERMARLEAFNEKF